MTRSFESGTSLFVSAFYDLNSRGGRGVFGGITVPFNKNLYASANVARSSSGMTPSVEIVRPLGSEPGDYGWRVRATEGAATFREASGSYRSPFGLAQVAVRQTGDGALVAADLRGSIAAMGGGVFLSNWIDDGFAVVSAGQSGLQVFHENRLVGTTDSRGMILVPTLRSNQNNKIHVDPTNLPVDATLATAEDTISPADRAGVMVAFRRIDDVDAALVVLRRPNGSFVPVGSVGKSVGGTEFVVGHDGQAFVRNLQPSTISRSRCSRATAPHDLLLPARRVARFGSRTQSVANRSMTASHQVRQG